jgi:hypothetical protein
MNAQQLARQREYRKVTGNRCTKKYEKTVNGFLMRTYRNMESRVTGIQKKKAHLYMGKPLLPREEFYEWAKNDLTFQTLFAIWGAQGYERKLTPSINRIDPAKGYELGNIEWLTHSENSRLGAIERARKYER